MNIKQIDKNSLIFSNQNQNNKINRNELENKIDIFTQSKFKEMIDAKLNNAKSYVLAVVKNESGNSYEYDGERFFSYLESSEHPKNPLTNLAIDSIEFWEITKNDALLFATLSDKSKDSDRIKKAIEYLVWANENIEPEELLLRERWLGLQYLQADNYDQAIVYLSRAAERGDSVSYKSLAWAYLMNNDYANSEKWFIKLHDSDPKNMEISFLLATVYELLLNFSSAWNLYLSCATQGNLMSICKVIEFLEEGLVPNESVQNESAKEWRARLPESLQNLPLELLYQKLEV